MTDADLVRMILATLPLATCGMCEGPRPLVLVGPVALCRPCAESLTSRTFPPCPMDGPWSPL